MVIIVHGGAGKIENITKRREGIIKACKLGYKVLENQGSAIDAVQSAVSELEDNPFFNAGTGATLSIEGEAELDAAIMKDDLQCGAVACIKGVKNPILVARKVLEETNHVLLVGEGATRFARLMGFQPYNPITLKRKKMLHKKFIDKYGTVGACAIDKDNRFASGTSTGGTLMHLPGRVGDTPVIGAGTYACEWGAVSCTGHGECIIKLCLAKTACDAMKLMTAQKAINLALKVAGKHGCDCGLIGVDKRGRVGFGFNTAEMIWAYIKNGELRQF